MENLYELVKLHSPDEAIDRNLQFNLRQVYDNKINFDQQFKQNASNDPYKVPEGKWLHKE